MLICCYTLFKLTWYVAINFEDESSSRQFQKRSSEHFIDNIYVIYAEFNLRKHFK